MDRQNRIRTININWKKLWTSLLSVRSRLTISFLAVLLIPSLLIGYFAYDTAKDQVQQQMMDKASTSVNMINAVINQFIQSKEREAETLAQSLNASTVDTQEGSNIGVSPEASRVLDIFKNAHPEIELAYIGTEDGVYINAPSDIKNPADYDPRERPWYKQAMDNKGKIVISPVNTSQATGNLVITIARTTPDGKGVTAIDVNLDKIKESAKSVTIGNKGYVYILDGEKTFIYHPEKAAGTTAPDNAQNANLFKSTSGTFQYLYNNQDYKEMVFTTNELTDWKIAGTFYTSEFSDSAAPILRTTLYVIILFVVLGTILAYAITRSITKPLKNLIAATKKMGSGDLTEEFHYTKRNELGELGASFNQMQNSIRMILSNVIETATQVAASSEELTASSEQTTKATEQIAQYAQQMAEGAEVQVRHVEASAETGDQVAERSHEIVASVSALESTASNTSLQTQEGGRAVKTAVEQMNSIQSKVSSLSTVIQNLGDRSAEIGSIVSVIQDISGQTGLLALNAAIEAARAGEQGRGFAVVADEVRKLADQSEAATKQITGLIQAIQAEITQVISSVHSATNEVNDGIAVIHHTGARFDGIRQAIEQITEQIQTVSEHSSSISQGTVQMAESLQNISSVSAEASSSTQNVAAAAQQTLASMEEIASSAGALSHMAEELQTLTNTFKLYKDTNQ
ncbi:methyl-accepting chemotaxis protein [Paenibacillus pinistramenti]|uniref:methyl-accepting chemotaxis protein n=1 Tax=Paenibacillus pinistramenti TaxID=1768003 RepID=UPI0011097813|nr:methyl-accepting chemotaxis protein [Paenibacillus pinistramenti]